mmetsp:Transcript_12927/g.21185  ORF Transcript_12927/g.21185 Transcript_12927/m.21185 type:complete len:83 (+) Transcript_12927:106-354(+)
MQPLLPAGLYVWSDWIAKPSTTCNEPITRLMTFFSHPNSELPQSKTHEFSKTGTCGQLIHLQYKQNPTSSAPSCHFCPTKNK